jgi:hypothetical protein
MLSFEATKSTPQISFSEEESTMRICGECYPENSFEFFKPIFDWFAKKFDEQKDFKLDVKISYMNSSSTKCILDILDILQEAHEKGRIVKVLWKYDKENDRAFELAEEFKEDFTMNFDIIPV